jgi:hypothetical protein
LVTSCHQVNCLARARILRDYGPRNAPRGGTESSLAPFCVIDTTLSGRRIMTADILPTRQQKIGMRVSPVVLADR